MQFSLKQLLLAVMCFAVALGAWSHLFSDSGPPLFNGSVFQNSIRWLLIVLIVAMPGIGAWLLFQRTWVGLMVAIPIGMFLWLLIWYAWAMQNA